MKGFCGAAAAIDTSILWLKWKGLVRTQWSQPSKLERIGAFTSQQYMYIHILHAHKHIHIYEYIYTNMSIHIAWYNDIHDDVISRASIYYILYIIWMLRSFGIIVLLALSHINMYLLIIYVYKRNIYDNMIVCNETSRWDMTCRSHFHSQLSLLNTLRLLLKLYYIYLYIRTSCKLSSSSLPDVSFNSHSPSSRLDQNEY